MVALAIEAGVSAPKAPPVTARDGVVDVLHGVSVPDPYRWLEDQTSPRTRAWIEAEDAYSRPLLDAVPGRARLRERITALLKVDVTAAPMVRGGRYFFMKRLADQDLFVIHLKQGLDGQDEVLVDPAPMSPDHTTSVNLEDVSQDGKLMAYGVRQGGQDEVSVRVMNVDTRRDLSDVLPKGRYESVSIKPDGSGVYYSRQTAEGPRVYYHVLGTEPSRDAELFGQGYGPEKIIVVDLAEGGRYLVIQVLYGSSADRTEVYYQDLRQPGAITPLVNDIPARFIAAAAGHQAFLQTNWKAPNERILAVDLEHPQREHWKEIVPEGDAPIEYFTLAGGKIMVDYTRDASSRLMIFHADGSGSEAIPLPALGSVGLISSRWEDNEAFFAFSSFVIPAEVYRYDVTRGESRVWARTEVPLDSSQFEVKQVWYASKDGTRVPMFVVAKKGLQLDGSSPALLTAYGGFNLNITPSFSAEAAVWVESGGVFALANLRGGGEFGEKWHRAGMLGDKQHVFDDFIAATEWLIRNKYTSPARMAITGTSNGGLLMGAMITQRPDLYGAVVCRYPLLDMLRYQDFLVAKFWVPEYGSADNAEQFKWLYAYSPYQHVVKGTDYPAVLLVSGDGDTRVAPLHARKMTAMLQWAQGVSKPILLDYDTKSGHSGGRPVSKQIDELTDEVGFLFWQLGVK